MAERIVKTTFVSEGAGEYAEEIDRVTMALDRVAASLDRVTTALREMSEAKKDFDALFGTPKSDVDGYTSSNSAPQ